MMDMDIEEAANGMRMRPKWSDPSDAVLARAVGSVDAMLKGSREPVDPIEKGLLNHIRMRREDGADPMVDRDGLVMATTRVMELDAEPISARVDTMGAARMVSLDMSLQREASMLMGLDEDERERFLMPDEMEAREAHWAAMRATIRFVEAESQEGLESVSRGDLVGASDGLSSAHRATIASARIGIGDQLDIRLLRVSGLISPETAAGLSTGAGADQKQDDMLVMAKAHAKGRRQDAPFTRSGDDIDRETSIESALIAMRMAHAIERGMYVPPSGEADAEKVRRIITEASYPDPETTAGKVVREAARQLTRAGVEDVFASPQLHRAVAREVGGAALVMFRDQDRSSARIAMDAALQMEAGRHLVDAERRIDETGLPGGERSRRSKPNGVSTLVNLGFQNLLTSSPRDVDDLRALASGDVERVSERNGMYSYLKVAVDRAGVQASMRAEAVRSASSPKLRFSVPVRGSDPSSPKPDLSSILKGPTKPETGADWIAAMRNSGGSVRE